MAIAKCVIDIVFPELRAEIDALEARQLEVDRMPDVRAEAIRNGEQLRDRAHLLRSLEHACCVAVCCLGGGRRDWRGNLDENFLSLWETRDEVQTDDRGVPVYNRIIGDFSDSLRLLSSPDVSALMDQLVTESRRCRNDEITRARYSSTLNSPGTQKKAIAAAGEAGARAVIEQLGLVPAAAPAPAVPEHPSPPPLPVPSGRCGAKRERESQDVVRYPFTFETITESHAYYLSDLLPLERETKGKWRSGRDNLRTPFSLHKKIADAVNRLVGLGRTEAEALDFLQREREARTDPFTGKTSQIQFSKFIRCFLSEE